MKVDGVFINNHDQISDHVVAHFENLFDKFSVLQENSLVEKVIPCLVSAQINSLLTSLPSVEEIRSAVFNLKRDNVADPDGFGPIFYHIYWSIIKDDVINATLQFFKNGWIAPNYNYNTLVLIPKVNEADNIDQYRPISLDNFKFKIITKVLADRLAQVLPHIISKEQKGFIQGRSIKDCICLTSKVGNMIKKKFLGGNVMLKVDIDKAFDTLGRSFVSSSFLLG